MQNRTTFQRDPSSAYIFPPSPKSQMDNFGKELRRDESVNGKRRKNVSPHFHFSLVSCPSPHPLLFVLFFTPFYYVVTL